MDNNYPSYLGRKKYTVQSSSTNRPGRMKRLNAKLQAEPEFAASFAAERADRTKIINAKALRFTAEQRARLNEQKQRIEDERCAAAAAIEHALSSYAFNCPEGTWTGRLEQAVWKSPTTLILCFIDTATGNRYQLERQEGTRYMPCDRSHDFQADAAPSDLFQLRTKKTKHGYPDLKSARKVTRDRVEIVVIKSRAKTR